MATTATVNIASDIYSGFSGISKTMTLTKAGTINNIEETTGFSRRRFAATTAANLIHMDVEVLDTAASTAAKVYVKNIGDGKGNVDKSVHVAISIGVAGATTQEISKLYGGDWLLVPVSTADDMDVYATPETIDPVVLEYVMFFEV